MRSARGKPLPALLFGISSLHLFQRVLFLPALARDKAALWTVTSATLWDSLGQVSSPLLSDFPCKVESPSVPAFLPLEAESWGMHWDWVYTQALLCTHCSHGKGGLGGITDALLTTILTVMGGSGETGSSRPSSLWGCPLHQPFPLPCFIFFYCRAASACGQ